MNKTLISNFLRSIRLLYTIDKIRYYYTYYQQKSKNQRFKKSNPDVKLPPPYLIYESFKLDYQAYYESGKVNVKEFIALFSNYISLENKKILDWGCGPGRVIRHFPDHLPTCEFYGTDYNEQSIAWCSENLPNIKFNKNSLEASLPYPDNYFDVIYGLSIFTHLSEKMHYEWFDELYRILKPNGILMVTTQGDNFKFKLSAEEQEQYKKGELVVRGNVKEGHRTYSAFQPPEFMKELLDKVTILDHLVVEPQKEWIPQDKWIISKKA